MYWDDLKRLIRENRRNPASTVKFYGPTRDVPNKMTICDFDFPHRDGVLWTGYSDSDWFRDSQVSIAHFENGELPLYGWYYDNSTKMVRGAWGVVNDLLSKGTLARTWEIKQWLRQNERPSRMPYDPLTSSGPRSAS